MARFDECLAHVLKEEGGNDDDPHDHGGRTSRGITQREYDAFRSSQGQSTADVWQASDTEVRAIYETQYWLPYCPYLPAGLDLEFFDHNVNAGLGQAVKALQRALGVSADGMFGIRTKQALAQCSDIGKLIHDYSEQRRAFYRALKQFPRYGKGWLARTDRIEWAAAGMAQAVPHSPASSPKADASDVKTPPISPETGGAAAGASAVGSGLVDQLQQATQHIAPFQDALPVIKYILIGCALIAFGFTVYGIFHRKQVEAVA